MIAERIANSIANKFSPVCRRNFRAFPGVGKGFCRLRGEYYTPVSYTHLDAICDRRSQRDTLIQLLRLHGYGPRAGKEAAACRHTTE